MPDLFNPNAKSLPDSSPSTARPASSQAKRKPRNSDKGRSHSAQLPLKYDGALTTALGEALASDSTNQTKGQKAQVVVPDVIAALEAFPGTKLSTLWPLLKKLDPENDGSTFQRAVLHALREQADQYPVISLSLRERGQAGKPAKPQDRSPVAETHGTAARGNDAPVEPDLAEFADQLRGLRAPGF